MTLISHILIVSLLPYIHSEIYENSKNLCEKCRCNTDNNDISLLDCNGQNLQHSLNNWPDYKVKLIANFAYNNITTLETLPPTLREIEIIYSHCGIKYLTTGMFVNVPNVLLLDLSYNELTSDEISSDKFKGPYNQTHFEPIALRHLNLAYNHIHSLSKNLFEHMPDLRILNLEGNHFGILDLHTQLALNSIILLENLNLAENGLTELIDDAIMNAKHLRELNLKGNQLDFVPHTALTQIGDTLEHLILDGNPIIELTDTSFLGLRQMHELSLNNLSIKYINANTFVPMSNLKKLHITNNIRLTNLDRDAFADEQMIDEINLKNNHIFYLDYRMLKWSNIRSLNLQDNPLDCTCDLYNITKYLIEDRLANRQSTYCLHITKRTWIRVDDMDNTVCTMKQIYNPMFVHRTIINQFTTLRMWMIILSTTVMLVTLIAICLAYLRYQKTQRNRNYPFVSQVHYNALATTSRF